MTRKAFTRRYPEAALPVLDLEGTTADCGERLGFAWRDPLRLTASQCAENARPWWQERRFAKVIGRCAPHLPALFSAMAKGAGVPDHKVGEPAPVAEKGGCTSFIIQPRAALDGATITGQTKDTHEERIYHFLVLRLALTDAPRTLTLTYPGWLFGHGFVRGGTAIFRNSLYAGEYGGPLPYPGWGLLALHCPTVEDVVKLVRDCGPNSGFHNTVADEHGGAIGIEAGKGGLCVLPARKGIYTHANAVVFSKRLKRFEDKGGNTFAHKNSRHRQTRLRELLEVNRGRLTAQLAYMALADHQGFPTSICRHESTKAMTTSAVVVEPSKGLLHATHGPTCQNWVQTVSL